MAELASITGATSGSSVSAAATAQVSSDRARADGDFQTFLSLLTAQLRNQDPLNPMESTQFVAQLASFSSVEQQVKTNETLSQLVGYLTGSSASGLSDWLGREIKGEVAARFEGEPVSIEYDVNGGATSALIVVKDVTGAQVAAFAVDPAVGQSHWDGKVADGSTAPSGFYSFEAVYSDSESTLSTLPARTYATVSEVRMGSDGTFLMVESGDTINLDSVTAIR